MPISQHLSSRCQLQAVLRSVGNPPFIFFSVHCVIDMTTWRGARPTNPSVFRILNPFCTRGVLRKITYMWRNSLGDGMHLRCMKLPMDPWGRCGASGMSPSPIPGGGRARSSAVFLSRTPQNSARTLRTTTTAAMAGRNAPNATAPASASPRRALRGMSCYMYKPAAQQAYMNRARLRARPTRRDRCQSA